MKGFFYAQSVAVVGVSTSAANLGRAIAFNLMEFQYDGCVYLVGPKGGSFLGHKIYKSVAEVPEPVELAVLLVPATAVPQVLRECGEKGIQRVVVESAGFRELGADRMALEEEVVGVLRTHRIRMIGPNCLGIINRSNGLAVPFMALRSEGSPWGVSIISQSGGVGVMMLNVLAGENLGLAKFASIGNKLDVDETELLDYLIADSATKVAYCYLEGIARGRKLMETAMASPKPIIVHKGNNGETGAHIAMSHSASLSANDKVVDAGLRQCGILRTRNQQDALIAMKAFSLPPMRGKRLAIISRSGGHAVIAADAAEAHGFTLPPFPSEVLTLVQERSRAKVIQHHNPMDLGDLFDFTLYRELVRNTLARDDIDGLVFIHTYQEVFEADESRNLILGFEELVREYGKPMAICVCTTRHEMDKYLRKADLILFSDPQEAVKALSLSLDHFANRPLPFSTERPAGVNAARARLELDAAAGGQLPQETLAAILDAYGVATVSYENADCLDDVLEAAERLGFPVALKTRNPDIVHKTDVGGVRLNLADSGALAQAYDAMCSLSNSVTVQKMVPRSLEWLVGGRQDENFGPVLVVGLGGIHVEVFGETSIRIAPITLEEADRLVGECRGASLLQGVRGEDSYDRERLLDLIVRVSWLLHDHPEISELDLNPVAVLHEGCMALDWRATREVSMVPGQAGTT